MARTEIKLNDVYYKLTRLPQQTLANQMASKVGQGSSEYGDLTTWSAWIQEDWQEGVGKIKPHRGGGFLYGEAESRVPGQLILPQRIRQLQREELAGVTGRTMAGDFPASITVSSTGTNRRAATAFDTGTTFSPLSTCKMWIYANIPSGTDLTLAIYTNSGSDLPNTLVASATYTPPEENTGYYWHGTSFSTTLSANTTYHLVVYPTTSGSFEWMVTDPATGGDAGADTYAGGGSYYNGSAWGYLSMIGGTTLSITTNLNPLATSTTNAGAGLFRFNGNLYCYSNNRVWKFSDANYWSEWTSVSAITNITAVTSVVVFGDTVYFGNEGGDGDYCTMNTSEVISDAGADGHIFAKWKGLLWRANDNYVEYSGDGSTWEPTTTFGDPIYVSDASDPVTGMCGMGNVMYVATTAGLVPVFEGDVVVGGRTWGSLDAQNGMRMVEFEGALYCIVNGRVIRFTEDGSMQDVWMTRDDDVLAGRIGQVWDLVRVNNWVFALVGATASNGKPTIWAYQNNSWHHIATLPNSVSTEGGLAADYGLYYDRVTSRLWAITPDFVTYHWYIPDYSLNPYNDPLSRYMATAWVEWDWFDGAILEVYKDYDSVTIMGENLSSGQHAEVYWKDDDSTAWEYLGDATSNITELRWSIDSGTRPNTRRLKLGFLIFTDSTTESPRIRAFRVKYHLMVRDWFRWNVQIDVSGRTEAYQLLADGTRNTLNQTQIKANLDALSKRVPPFVYQDVDGQTYEVKITDANMPYTKYEYNESTTSEWWEGTYNLVIEQVTQDVYVAP